MKTQKELKEIYKENLKLAWDDPRMVDYCSKQADEVVETEDGWLLEVERQNIETHFCFGYGYCGLSDDESENDASESCHNARTNEDYFIKENLKYYDEHIKDLEENDCFVNLKGHYTGQTKDCKLSYFKIGKYSHWSCIELENNPEFRKLNENEKLNLIDAFKSAKAKMEKRLNVYLKKYGLSKLSCWTYLRD